MDVKTERNVARGTAIGSSALGAVGGAASRARLLLLAGMLAAGAAMACGLAAAASTSSTSKHRGRELSRACDGKQTCDDGKETVGQSPFQHVCCDMSLPSLSKVIITLLWYL